MTLGDYVLGEGLLGLLLLAVLLLWLVGRQSRRAERRARPHDPDAIDRDELESAEREVRDLDAWRTPEEEAEEDDWGPGTYRPTSRR